MVFKERCIKKKDYSNREISLIKRHYPRKGARRTAEILRSKGFDRSANGVCKKARKLTAFGELSGFVPVVDVHPRRCGDSVRASDAAVRQAERDGVLLKVGNKSHTVLLVPEDWADKYLEDIDSKIRADSECKTWMRTGEIAELLGIHPQTASTYYRRPKSGAVSRAIQRMTVRKGMCLLYWEPKSVRRAMVLFHRETGGRG